MRGCGRGRGRRQAQGQRGRQHRCGGGGHGRREAVERRAPGRQRRARRCGPGARRDGPLSAGCAQTQGQGSRPGRVDGAWGAMGCEGCQRCWDGGCADSKVWEGEGRRMGAPGSCSSGRENSRVPSHMHKSLCAGFQRRELGPRQRGLLLRTAVGPGQCHGRGEGWVRCSARAGSRRRAHPRRPGSCRPPGCCAARSRCRRCPRWPRRWRS